MRTSRRAATLLVFVAFALSSCGGGSNETRPVTTGSVSVALTDTPSLAFDNVWVTVTRAWFHQAESAPFDPAGTGWVQFNFPGGVTVNLAALSGDNNVVTVFDNLALPVGTYRQMLLFLEPTENARTTSASAKGLRFNNQVDAGTLHAALRVPNAAQGIRLADRLIPVAEGTPLRLAIDLNVGRDVLPFNRGTVQEFLLQPRPLSFDLDNAGAIVGFIDNVAAADSAALFEVLAEQFDATLGARVVRRAAAVDNATGKFVLYPLVPTTSTGPQYDIVIRGIGRRTAIVTSVPVAAGTTPGTNPTIMGTPAKPIPIDNAALPEFRIAATITLTSGALGSFYQILGSDAPYLIRQANFDPLSATIADFPLSSDQVRIGPFSVSTFKGGVIDLPLTTPTPANGSYFLIAESPLYVTSSFTPPASPNVTPLITISNPVVITGLTPGFPAVATTVDASATIQPGDVPLDNVVFFATFGGTILNAQAVGSVTASPATGTIVNLPGGAPGTAFSLASYGVSAYGWRTSGDNVLRIGPPNTLAKPQTGDDSVSFTMQRVTVP